MCTTMTMRPHLAAAAVLLALVTALAIAGDAPNVPNFGPNFNASTQANMNGAYVMSTTPGGKPGLFPENYKDYPGGAESFEVYSPPMTTRYSQVRETTAVASFTCMSVCLFLCVRVLTRVCVCFRLLTRENHAARLARCGGRPWPRSPSPSTL